MADKLHTILQQVEELEVAGFKGGEVLRAHGGIQIPWLDAGELSQVVHNL